MILLEKLLSRAGFTRARAASKKSEIMVVDPKDPIEKPKNRLKRHDRDPFPVETRTFSLPSVHDFPKFDAMPGEGALQIGRIVGDAAAVDAARELFNTSATDIEARRKVVFDDYGTGMLKNGVDNSAYAVPAALQAWYQRQSFIGYQSCAVIAQHWLVDKACSMSGEDAVRNGWVLKARGGEDLNTKDHDTIKEADKAFKVKENLIELNRFKNVFGIRVCIFQVESDDPYYYEKPFNIDGIKKGSYMGISQVDPYWMMPVMTTKGTARPSDKDFYDPEYWFIDDKKYHKSHLVIVRGPQPADILKPMYIFGGIPLTQRIYERVYAAERTANEAPELASSKRTTAVHADLEQVAANQDEFYQRLLTWIMYRDNHGVKVLGKDEVMEQFDISLSDFDSVVMNQYQLVAAIARTPATKLLGTSPKGFNATGEFEMKSYHEELESVQEHTMMPLLGRHYDILVRHLGVDCEIEVVCNPVDSLTAKERAELNYQNAQTAEVLIANGSISPDEDRQRLRDDEHSGYNRLTDAPAEEEPGASPENLANFEKAGAQLQKGNAAEVTAGAQPEQGATPGDVTGGAAGANSNTLQALVPVLLQQMIQGGAQQAVSDPAKLMLMTALAMYASGSGKEPESMENPIRGTLPGTQRTVKNGVGGVHETIGKLQGADAILHSNGDRTISRDEFDAAPEEVRSYLAKLNPSVERSTAPSISREKANNVAFSRDAAANGMDWNPRKLPKMRLHGLNIAIENPRDSIRKGVDMSGTWETKMPHHYGFIKGYGGADGDEVDCFIGPNLRAKDVFVIAQKDPQSGEFDEYKCMLGFDDEDSALNGYIDSFSRDWDGLDGIQRMSTSDFLSWLESGAAEQPPSAVHA